MTMLFCNCKIKTIAGKDIENGYIRIDGAIISDVGEMKDFKKADNEHEIDLCHNVTVYPGFIDAHSHVGVFGDSQGQEATDANEVTDPVTPHLSALDAVNPADRCFDEALMAGVTTVITGVGSANVIGGSLIAVKTYGSLRLDNRVIKSPIAIKMALGENPKMCYQDRDEAPTTRMASAAAIREQLSKARRYLEDIAAFEQSKRDGGDLSLPEYDAKNEALLPLLRGEINAHIHCHRADDIFTAIRICNEFKIGYVLVHVTECAKIADELKEEALILGPVICERSKPELAALDITAAAQMSKAGANFAVCTDHPVVPIQYLPLCAGLCIRGGLDENEALKAITLNAAKICGIDDRVGSIETGKDADLLFYKSDAKFYDVLATPHTIIAGGKIVKSN
ncbi:MAG: amidohydrolase family protein [Oscillospiraceae bacterium]|nr:amidohydrolase family protein [Oscillospiraceae bacterium]